MKYAETAARAFVTIAGFVALLGALYAITQLTVENMQ